MDVLLMLGLLAVLLALLGATVLFLRYSTRRGDVLYGDFVQPTVNDTRARPPSVDRMA
jgi:hypothetical protein